MSNRRDTEATIVIDAIVNAVKPEINLGKAFPQIFKRDGKVKRSNLRKKYSLREAMTTLKKAQDCYNSTIELSDKVSLKIFTMGGTVEFSNEATIQIMKNREIIIDVIEAGWEFYIIGC